MRGSRDRGRGGPQGCSRQAVTFFAEVLAGALATAAVFGAFCLMEAFVLLFTHGAFSLALPTALTALVGLAGLAIMGIDGGGR